MFYSLNYFFLQKLITKLYIFRLLHLSIIQNNDYVTNSIIDMCTVPTLLDIMNDDWETPLHLAVITKQPNIVRKLLLSGADLLKQNINGNTALHLACKFGNFLCVKALTQMLSKEERFFTNAKNFTPLILKNLEETNYNGNSLFKVQKIIIFYY